MSAEIIGMVSTQEGSETRGASGPAVDPAWLRDFAQAHEEAGFDRVLIGYSSSSPDGFAVAAAVLAATTRLKVLIAHRPGFASPTVVARKLATLDALFGGGRVGIHHISGGSDVDQARDGDYTTKEQRYARTGEFIDVLRRTLASQDPFDYEGEHYRVDGAYSAVKPTTDAGIPIFFGGLSGAAVEVGGRHADTFALFGEPLAATAERIGAIREAAAAHGREIDFSLSTRPVVAATEDEAWAKTREILKLTQERMDRAEPSDGLRVGHRNPNERTSESFGRLQEHARSADVHDERLWFGITKLAAPGGNSTGHVGTAEQVADSLLEYWDLGVRKFLIRGYDQLGDVRQWGRDLVPALRAGIALREAAEAKEAGANLVGTGATI